MQLRVTACALWLGITKILDEDKPVKEEHKKYWRIGQWFTTGFLWWTWLSHDMANIQKNVSTQRTSCRLDGYYQCSVCWTVVDV